MVTGEKVTNFYLDYRLLGGAPYPNSQSTSTYVVVRRKLVPKFASLKDLSFWQFQSLSDAWGVQYYSSKFKKFIKTFKHYKMSDSSSSKLNIA